MRINNKTCTRCVNDRTIKHIHFDNKGVCNFCNSYDKISPVLENQSYLDKVFQNKIKDHTHTYDVALGFSGGKDSTYVLYQLVNKYKLKVITYTLDNGFLSEEAKNKIDRLVKELGVVHEYVVCDMRLLKEMYKVMVEKYLSLYCLFLFRLRCNVKLCNKGRRCDWNTWKKSCPNVSKLC
ncbi:MAG: 7-cyano-7-deazaguanine synthase [Anaeroplasmataceae bacterium]|nr:7-cyano-7-deazaguanine synthase [Anaeroplasmataceae bacterium]